MIELQDDEVDASPTKEFFIKSITKDIHLIDVVPDLIGNCLDGARRIGKVDDLSGLKIFVDVYSDHFKIKDNCGGIELDNAKNYAFKFGRKEDDQKHTVKGSIGEFGIGMKRAIFRMGNNAIVESKTSSDHFVVTIDVEDWKRKEDWVFNFKSIQDAESPNNLSEEGTVVQVTNLHRDVSASFNDYFISELSDKIETKFSGPLNKGLEIVLNGIPISSQPIKLAFSGQIKPVKYEMTIGEKDKEVIVKMYLGITERDPHAAGFYIFCNGQLVLGADKSDTTGWDDKEKSLSQYHNDFAYFRGYIFFTSDFPSLFPWDTTKTRINNDSGVYKAVKLEMVKKAKPILDFLRKLASEKAKDEEGNKPTETPLNDLVSSAIQTSKQISTLAITSTIFQEPSIPKPKKSEPKKTGIQYKILDEKYQKVKKKLKAKTKKEVGIRTFDYYYDNEIEGE